jgi:hypothetical protein
MPTAAQLSFSDTRLIPLKNPKAARKENVNLRSGTYAAGTIIGELPSTPGTYGAYNSTNSSSTTNPASPSMLLEYGCVVDTDGNIWIGDTTGVSEWGQPAKSISAFRNGLFSVADLVGVTANSIAGLGRLVRGNSTAGELLVTGS